MDDAFDSSAYSLHPVQVRVDEGLIFLCLAQDPPDFDTVARDIEGFFHPHGCQQAKIATRARHVIRANWKLVTENFWECYSPRAVCGAHLANRGFTSSRIAAWMSA